MKYFYRALPKYFTFLFLIFSIFLSLLYASTIRKPIDNDSEVILKDYKEIYLSVLPRNGEGYVHIAAEFTNSEDNWRKLRELNGDKKLLKGKRYRIPFSLLKSDYRLMVIEKLFPKDYYKDDCWVHHISAYSTEETESLWRIAEWFTGDGANYKEIASCNNMKDYTIKKDQKIIIPEKLLLPAFVTDPYENISANNSSELEFGTDSKGEYALYCLKPGEALYSAVVVRFTGLLEADEVIATAMQIAERSNIKDVTDISVGYPVKIPRELLLPEYLPRNDPRRREFESVRERAAAYKLERASQDLQGVYVVLDPGHGGADPGAMAKGVWEDDYVYDISCRIKRILENETSAKVLMSLKDKSSGFKVFDKTKLSLDQDELIQTNPPFAVKKGQTAIGVNLRWYFANYHFNSLVKKGVEEDRIVFTSIHADSLHKSVRGAMIYVPGSKYAQSKFGKNSAVYTKRREVKSKQYFSVSRKDKRRSEGFSYNFSKSLIKELKKNKLGVHPYNPVRDHVVRRKSSWLPAVLRYNIIPTKILIEVCNINNSKDASLMKKPEYREKFARAYVNALKNYYLQN